MTQGVDFRINDRPSIGSICSLRAAVGYDRNEEEYHVTLEHYDTTVSAYDENGSLVGWCAAVTDGAHHGFLVDVIVHPEWQRHGIGRSLVRQMLESLLANGISVVHADFKEEHAAFYKECGFRIGPGGIYERRK